MLLGVPKEIKEHEYRVGMTPISVNEVVARGHQVLVQCQAGSGIGYTDEDYQKAGAELVTTAEEIFARAELIIKVKEPQLAECKMLRPGQILFTYLHLAADKKQADLLAASGCIAIAYETVTNAQHQLPLLLPMSEVAGRMSIQAGAHCLEKEQGGRGILLGGVPGVAPANVVVIGGGIAGTGAARMAMGIGAHVTILDKSLQRLQELNAQFGSKVNTIFSTRDAIEHYVQKADLVVGAVLIPGAAAPKLVSHQLVKKMRKGSVLVDIAIDQGGCFETSHATTHTHPTYEVDGVLHYCVDNMPGAVPHTSTFALNNATLPFILELADQGLTALSHNKYLLQGLNIAHGHFTHAAVADALNKPFVEPSKAL